MYEEPRWKTDADLTPKKVLLVTVLTSEYSREYDISGWVS